MKIVLIGAGNVATHLGKQLARVGEEVLQVFSRKLLNANQLALSLNARATDSFANLEQDADLYLISVHDDAIPSVARQLSTSGLSDKLIVHTSGATPRRVLDEAGLHRTGVFYPLQTFTKGKEPDFSKLPICVDASQDADLQQLVRLGQQLGSQVFSVNDDDRAWLHVAAVFVNNFTNHLFAIGQELVRQRGLHFEMLLPLIGETVAKLHGNDAKAMQTGPAVRHDEATIKRHLQLLEGQPAFQEIYRILTKNIETTHADNRQY